MAYDFSEATFTAAVKKAVDQKIGLIPNIQTQKAIRAMLIEVIELVSDELELIDAAA